MAKAESTVVVKVLNYRELKDIEAAAWLEGMNHALTWLGLKHYADAMAKDNPHAAPEVRPTGFPPRPLRKDKVG